MRKLHICLDDFAHAGACFLQLVDPSLVDQLLNVRLLPIQLLQRVVRVLIRLLRTINCARSFVLVEDSERG